MDLLQVASAMLSSKGSSSTSTVFPSSDSSIPEDAPLNEADGSLHFIRGTKKVTDVVHTVANEPSVGLFRVREHIQKSLPFLVERKKEIKSSAQRLEGIMFDLNYTTKVIDNLKNVTVFESILRQVQYSIKLKQGIDAVAQISSPPAVMSHFDDFKDVNFSNLHRQVVTNPTTLFQLVTNDSPADQTRAQEDRAAAPEQEAQSSAQGFTLVLDSQPQARQASPERDDDALRSSKATAPKEEQQEETPDALEEEDGQQDAGQDGGQDGGSEANQDSGATSSKSKTAKFAPAKKLVAKPKIVSAGSPASAKKTGAPKSTELKPKKF